MVAEEHLSPEQFPVRRLSRLRSEEWGGSVRDLLTHPSFTGTKYQEHLKSDIQRHGMRDPVDIIRTPRGGYRLAHGHHRAHVAMSLGLDTLPALVHPAVQEGGKTTYPSLEARDRKIVAANKRAGGSYQMKWVDQEYRRGR